MDGPPTSLAMQLAQPGSAPAIKTQATPPPPHATLLNIATGTSNNPPSSLAPTSQPGAAPGSSQSTPGQPPHGLHHAGGSPTGTSLAAPTLPTLSTSNLPPPAGVTPSGNAPMIPTLPVNTSSLPPSIRPPSPGTTPMKSSRPTKPQDSPLPGEAHPLSRTDNRAVWSVFRVTQRPEHKEWAWCEPCNLWVRRTKGATTLMMKHLHDCHPQVLETFNHASLSKRKNVKRKRELDIAELIAQPLQLGQRPRCVTNEADLPWATLEDRGLDLSAGIDGQPQTLKSIYNYRRKQLGKLTGAEKLGCSLIELEPLATAFPFHAHAKSEEAVFVLQGTGTMRVGDNNFTVKSGDYCTFRAGKEMAHQLINDSDKEILRYLCISTNNDPDVMIYPDSGKVGLTASSLFEEVKQFYVENQKVDYFTGEGLRRQIKLEQPGADGQPHSHIMMQTPAKDPKFEGSASVRSSPPPSSLQTPSQPSFQTPQTTQSSNPNRETFGSSLMMPPMSAMSNLLQAGSKPAIPSLSMNSLSGMGGLSSHGHNGPQPMNTSGF